MAKNRREISNDSNINKQDVHVGNFTTDRSRGGEKIEQRNQITHTKNYSLSKPNKSQKTMLDSRYAGKRSSKEQGFQTDGFNKNEYWQPNSIEDEAKFHTENEADNKL